MPLFWHMNLISLIWNSFSDIYVQHEINILKSIGLFHFVLFAQSGSPFAFVWCFPTMRFRLCILTDYIYNENILCSIWVPAKLLQFCLTVCNPLDCNLPGSSVHGLFQARILEWVAIFYSRGSSWPRDQTHVSCISCIDRQILYLCTTWETRDTPYPIPVRAFKWLPQSKGLLTPLSINPYSPLSLWCCSLCFSSVKSGKELREFE